ncbi:MAG: RNA polymerase sigma factor [Bacteroidota bacterium]
MTDAQIMELVKKDQLRYLSVIFDRYADRLFLYFRQMTGDSYLSEDLTQNVFEGVIRSRHAYEERGAFKSWLFRIAKNVLIVHARKQKGRYNVGLNGFDVAEEIPIDNREEYSEQKKQLLKAMEKLKTEHREIIMLTKFENLNYKEVAEIIGISETGVKARVFRAMKSLKKAYFQNVSTR